MTVMMISLIIILIVLLSTYNIDGFKHIYTNKVITRLNAYCLNVNLYIKPERRDEFLQVIKQNAQGARTNEPKCRLYVYGESVTATNTFHFQEIYDDKDGFLQHTSRYINHYHH